MRTAIKNKHCTYNTITLKNAFCSFKLFIMYKVGDIVRIKTIEEMLAIPGASMKDDDDCIHFQNGNWYFSPFMHLYINTLCRIHAVEDGDDHPGPFRLETRKEKLPFGFTLDMIEAI